MEGIAMKPLIQFILSLACLTPGGLSAAEAKPSVESRPHVIVVVGAGGERQYGELFASWAMRVKEAAEQAGAQFTAIGLNKTAGKDDLRALRETLEAADPESNQELWLILIGHGTFNGRTARFNLRGPDLTATQLAEWLEPFTRPVALVNCASCSAPFLNKLKAPNRVIISATKSGNEITFTRFGDYFTAALAGRAADLDKDEQVSLLEMFLSASKRVYAHYESEGQLATEHALIDDNGDGLGSRAEWFKGVRATRKSASGKSVDGYRAHQIHLIRSEFERKLSPELRAERDRLEMALNRHRERKPRMKEDVYYSQLEKILIQISRIYQQAEAQLEAEKAREKKKITEKETADAKATGKKPAPESKKDSPADPAGKAAPAPPKQPAGETKSQAPAPRAAPKQGK